MSNEHWYDRYKRELIERFNEAANPSQQQSHTEQEGSRMVAEDQPAPRLTPDNEIGRAMDAQSFDQRWLQEQAEATERAEQAKREFLEYQEQTRDTQLDQGIDDLDESY